MTGFVAFLLGICYVWGQIKLRSRHNRFGRSRGNNPQDRFFK